MNLRLSPLLLAPLLLCASLADAAEPSADAASGAGCESLLTVVRHSLEKEIDATCAVPAPAPASTPAPANACAAQREPLRAIVDFISEREAASADQCDTLLEVNKRLRSLPPKG
ncbi:hypothetical protein [Cupriavidus basilensis]|uniref:hypothetical protein n=1 Tax=Cupriavidus basilensis TaxID=68895 RepID=UPI0020A6A34F|nr:hypothetical protein [Cupriavidus basilensis]MCP3022246.1 hypothetical protein [Cupriavidus basilensis]MDR3379449.1 hypothetical protein [Cupriavidus basilensis]